MPRSKVLELVIHQPCDLNDAKGKFATKSHYLGYVLTGEINAEWQETLFGSADAIVRARARKGKYFSDEPDEPNDPEKQTERTEPVPCEG